MIQKKTKSRFVKGIECQICHRVGSLQILGNYLRIRHYEKLINGKPTFTYHRNDKDYIDRILANIKSNSDQNVKADADQKDDLNSNQHDLSLQESNSKSETGNQFLRILVPESTIRLEPVWV